MTEPWTPLQTWLLIGPLLAGISLLAWAAIRWQRRNHTPTETQWVDDWWFTYGHHFDPDLDHEAYDGPGAA